MAPLSSNVSEKSKLSMSSLKDAQTIIEAGHPEGWGCVLELPVNKEKPGLGYQSIHVAQQKIPISAEKQVLPLLDTFISARHLFEGKIVMVNDEFNIPEAECFVYKKAPVQVLSNWTFLDLSEATFCQT